MKGTRLDTVHVFFFFFVHPITATNAQYLYAIFHCLCYLNTTCCLLGQRLHCRAARSLHKCGPE